MAGVVEHLHAVEAGRGKNAWVNRRLELLVREAEEREVSHIELAEFILIVEDITEAGWSFRAPSRNETISNMALLHAFEKVDSNGDHEIDLTVSHFDLKKLFRK